VLISAVPLSLRCDRNTGDVHALRHDPTESKLAVGQWQITSILAIAESAQHGLYEFTQSHVRLHAGLLKHSHSFGSAEQIMVGSPEKGQSYDGDRADCFGTTRSDFGISSKCRDTALRLARSWVNGDDDLHSDIQPRQRARLPYPSLQ